MDTEPTPGRSSGLADRVRRLLGPYRSLLADPSVRLLILGVGAGALGGLMAGLFDIARVGIGLVGLALVDPSVNAPVWWRALLVPTVGGALAGAIVQRFASHQRPVGMAHLVEAVQLQGGRVSLRDGVSTGIAAAISLGTGHSGGREAPVAGLAAAVAHAVATRLGIRPVQIRVLAASAAAAAIAASFNTPVGAALIALEVILGSFALQHFGPVVAATVTGTLVGQALLGERVAFHAPPFSLSHPAELLAFAGLGVLCGIVAHGFRVTLIRIEARSARMDLPVAVRGAIAGLGIGLLSVLGLNEVMGTGYPLIDRVLTEPASIGIPLLLAIVVGKTLATAATFSGRTGPGLFTPMLAVGAAAGALYGSVLSAFGWLPAEDVGSYGIVAMGAVSAAVLHAPIAMTLVLFELTNDYAVVPMMLLTVGVSSVVASLLDPESLYDAILLSRGVHLHRGLPADLRANPVSSLMRTEGFVRVAPELTVEHLSRAFRGTRDDLVWVVDEEGRYRGGVDVQDVLDLLSGTSEAEASSLIRELPALRGDQPLATALEQLLALDVDELPVVDDQGVLVGVLCERALVAAMH